VIAIVLAGAGIAGAFPDVSGTRFQDSAEYLRGLGVIVGDPDGSFYPLRQITRAEAVKIVIMVLGRGGDTAALAGSPAFPDTAGHWASGFVALARNLEVVDGFPDGTFKPNDLVTYAQMAKMLVEAAGLGPDLAYSWPDNYVRVAQAHGMLSQVPGFTPNAQAVRGDCVIMTAYTVGNVVNPANGQTLAQFVFSPVAAVNLTPTSASTPVGAGVEFSATVLDGEGRSLTGLGVGFTTSSPRDASISQTGVFGSPKAGAYTVYARCGGLTQTSSVVVFGPAVGLEASPAEKEITATNTKATVTVSVVDALGNTVGNDHSTQITMGYAAEGNNGAVTLGTAVKSVEAGKATFEITSSLNEERTDILEFSAPGLAKAHVTVSTVVQVPTAIRLTAAPTSLRANAPTRSVITATVMDQYGIQMTKGFHTLVFSITGPGDFGGTVMPRTVLASAGEAQVDVYSIQGSTGTIVVSVSSGGLPGVSVEIPTYVAGVPAAIAARVVHSTVTAATSGPGVTGAEFYVDLLDSQGRPTAATGDIGLTVELGSGQTLSYKGLQLTGDAVIRSGETGTAALGIKALDAVSGIAGTYVVRVTPSDSRYDPVSLTIQVVPGEPAALRVIPQDSVAVPIVNPTATFTMQLVDAAGNAVPRGGLRATYGWADLGAANSGKPTLNGHFSPPSDPAQPDALSALTDANGRVQVSFSAQAYVGDDYRLLFRYGVMTGQSGPIAIAAIVPGSLSLKVLSTTGVTVASVRANQSEAVELEATLRDTNGGLLSGWPVKITLTGEGINVRDVVPTVGTVVTGYANGTITMSSLHSPGSEDHGKLALLFKGAKAGAFNITAEATGLAQPVTASSGFRTDVGGVVAGVGVRTASGAEFTSLDVEGGTPVQLRLVPLDHGGNITTAPGDIWVKVHNIEGLYTTGSAGEFRLTISGTGVGQGGYITIPRGGSFATIYYVQPAAQDLVFIGTDDSDGAYVAYRIATVSKTAAPEGLDVTFAVTDAASAPVGGVAVTFAVTVGATDATSGITGSDGRVTVRWTGGTGGVLRATVRDALRGGGGPVEIEENWP
jgi:hypothetical protein